LSGPFSPLPLLPRPQYPRDSFTRGPPPTVFTSFSIFIPFLFQSPHGLYWRLFGFFTFTPPPGPPLFSPRPPSYLYLTGVIFTFPQTVKVPGPHSPLSFPYPFFPPSPDPQPPFRSFPAPSDPLPPPSRRSRTSSSSPR